MDKLEETVDEVLVVWRDLMARSPNGLSVEFWECERDALGALGPWRREIENAVMKLAGWDLDRADLITAARQAWAGDELSANFEAIADELLTLAQNRLRDTLISARFNAANAAVVAKCFRMGARLTRPDVHIDSPSDTTGRYAM
jgi:hypothetical protein